MHEYGLAARDQDAVRLAQPGGGAHGAFTWGVLDHLLEAELFRYEGISGTSAGAINAVVLASGWLAGGAPGARANLAALWPEVAEIACRCTGAGCHMPLSTPPPSYSRRTSSSWRFMGAIA